MAKALTRYSNRCEKFSREDSRRLVQKLKLDNVIFECPMIQSISYNLTDKESTLLKVSAKMFEERYKFILFYCCPIKLF